MERARARALLSLLAANALCLCAAAGFELTLLHTNDVHARVEETSVDSGKCTRPGTCFAGVARRFSKIEEIRRREPNVLLLDAGDQFQGTVWFNVFKGSEAAYFMKRLGYDGMALGNHEFDNGVNGLIEPFLRNVTFPVLSANIKPDETLAVKLMSLYRPYVILSVSSEKVGIVGYTSKETPALSMPGPHLVFQDEIETLQIQVDKLVTLGVNKIIALGHSGFAKDKEIAKKVRGVDVVIGGHTNTFLYTDLDIRAEVEEWKKKLSNYSSQVIGQTLVYLNGTFEECRFRECNLGNLICDAMVHHNIKYADEVQWNHVGSCILNGGAIRAPIDERSRNGSITMEDLISVLPFGGTFDLVQLQGSTLKSTFEHSVKRYGGGTGEFLQVSGIKVEFDLSRSPGDRVKEIKILCTKCRVPQYEPLDPQKLYKLVIPSYLVDGGDGFSMIKEEKLKHSS
ncbi:5'-nucleotidase-like, partial [Scleropages formosus]